MTLINMVLGRCRCASSIPAHRINRCVCSHSMSLVKQLKTHCIEMRIYIRYIRCTFGRKYQDNTFLNCSVIYIEFSKRFTCFSFLTTFARIKCSFSIRKFHVKCVMMYKWHGNVGCFIKYVCAMWVFCLSLARILFEHSNQKCLSFFKQMPCVCRNNAVQHHLNTPICRREQASGSIALWSQTYAHKYTFILN